MGVGGGGAGSGGRSGKVARLDLGTLLLGQDPARPPKQEARGPGGRLVGEGRCGNREDGDPGHWEEDRHLG